MAGVKGLIVKGLIFKGLLFKGLLFKDFGSKLVRASD